MQINASFCLSDPCERNNLAFSHLDRVEQLIKKLIDYQEKALPVWFPERDPSANPDEHHGYWGPWMTSKANSAILRKVIDSIPEGTVEKKHHHPRQNISHGGKIGKVFSTHAVHDEEVYEMLKDILHLAKTRKKGHIPKGNSLPKRESLAMLYDKMKEKTKVDKLMHKLQMIKKGRVAKRKGQRSKKHDSNAQAHRSSYAYSKLRHNKGRKDYKNGTKRTRVQNFMVGVEERYHSSSSSILENKEDTEETWWKLGH